MVRFGSSGTEVTMHCLPHRRAPRLAATKLSKFEGSYHGLHDTALVQREAEETEYGDEKRAEFPFLAAARCTQRQPVDTWSWPASNNVKGVLRIAYQNISRSDCGNYSGNDHDECCACAFRSLVFSKVCENFATTNGALLDFR